MNDQRQSVWREELAIGPKAIQGAGLIAKACDVLDIVGKAPGGVTIAPMRQETGIPRATLYRILAALVTRGLVRLDPVTQA